MYENVVIQNVENSIALQSSDVQKTADGYFQGTVVLADKGNAGIGLSVCATIVKAHGGSIIAENRPAGGACFRITLDLEKGEADEK